MPANPSGDEEETCPECNGEGAIEVSYPVSCNAEEPDIRMERCPLCGDDYDPEDYIDEPGDDYWDYLDSDIPDSSPEF